MKAVIEIELDDAKAGKPAMLKLAELMTRLTAQVLRAGVVTPIKLTDDAGVVVASLTIDHSNGA